MLPTESALSPETPRNSDLVQLASTLALTAPEENPQDKALDSKNTVPDWHNRQCSVPSAYQGCLAIIPDDLTMYPNEFEAFSRFFQKLQGNIHATGGQYRKMSGNSDEQKGTSVPTVSTTSMAGYLDSLVKYYTGETGPLAIIPKLGLIIPPPCVDGVRAPFFPRILNSIARTLEHPQRSVDTTPEEAPSNFIDGWTASRSSFGMNYPLPNAYCLVEAEVATIPNVYGNSATPLNQKQKTREMVSLEEWILEHIYRRVVGYLDGKGLVENSSEEGWGRDQCAEIIAWGYIEGYAEIFFRLDERSTLVITSLTMLRRNKTKRWFCLNCKERALKLVRKYPRLTIIDLGQTPHISYDHTTEA
ncbi:hypothetical protein D9613_003635 [Agrocybe pediades]|uniref:Uncharacterized protein n=1 Tax=Agrocybe pediades TaxID=84607 RepID=A0A8H4VII9_9AGAR|nr:hypothetical protein D9613_003635 [Agrocybe pediades]